MGNRHIVVTVGRKPGVYPSWEIAAPHVLGVPGAVWKGYASETEAYTAYGRATMAGQKRTLGADGSDETSSQPARVKKQERRPQTVGARNDTKAGIKGDDSLEEIVVQCPPVSSSRHHSTIERASTLPFHQPPNSLNNPVRRSKTAPNLDSRSIPSTPKRNVRGQKPQAPDISRSRVISISTDGCTTDEETIPSSPATDVSSTLSPTFGRHHLPSSPPRETTLSISSPVRPGGQGDGNQTRPQCCRSSTREGQQNHQTPTAWPVRGSKSSAHTISASPSKKAPNTPGIPVQSTTQRGVSHQHQPTKKVVWGLSSSTNRPLSMDERGTTNPTSHLPRDRSESRPPPSPGGSSQLTYVSDDERPAARPTHPTGDSDYYTPSSRNSEISDADSELPTRVPCSTPKRKGKRRASPPLASSPNEGSSVKESRSPSPSLSIESSPRKPNSVSGPSYKKRRDRYSRPPSPVDGISGREQSQPQEPGRSLGQDVCHCTGPCPCCHKPRFPPPPQIHPFMYHPSYYPYPYLPPPHPHMQTGYPLTHYGPSPYPYPYAMPQQSDLLPSVSSARPPPLPSGYPMPPTLPTYPPTAHPIHAPIHASPAPAPASSTPVPALPTSSPIPPTSPLDSPREDALATKHVSPELLDALGQFYQPPQRPVTVIDPSCDPRSPYGKQAAVPAFPNSPIVLGRPGTPLSPLKGLGLAL